MLVPQSSLRFDRPPFDRTKNKSQTTVRPAVEPGKRGGTLERGSIPTMQPLSLADPWISCQVDNISGTAPSILSHGRMNFTVASLSNCSSAPDLGLSSWHSAQRILPQANGHFLPYVNIRSRYNTTSRRSKCNL